MSEDALTAVPRSYREASLALGATKWQTIRRQVMPASIPGIATGSILGSGLGKPGAEVRSYVQAAAGEAPALRQAQADETAADRRHRGGP